MLTNILDSEYYKINIFKVESNEITDSGKNNPSMDVLHKW